MCEGQSPGRRHDPAPGWSKHRQRAGKHEEEPAKPSVPERPRPCVPRDDSDRAAHARGSPETVGIAPPTAVDAPKPSASRHPRPWLRRNERPRPGHGRGWPGTKRCGERSGPAHEPQRTKPGFSREGCEGSEGREGRQAAPSRPSLPSPSSRALRFKAAAVGGRLSEDALARPNSKVATVE